MRVALPAASSSSSKREAGGVAAGALKTTEVLFQLILTFAGVPAHSSVSFQSPWGCLKTWRSSYNFEIAVRTDKTKWPPISSRVIRPPHDQFKCHCLF